MNQHWNHRNIPPQRGSSLEANKIHGIIKATSPGLIHGIDPTLTHHRQQNPTRCHVLINHLTEVPSRLNAGHIHEYFVRAELADEISKQTTRLAFGVVPSITQKDGTHVKPQGVRVLPWR